MKFQNDLLSKKLMPALRRAGMAAHPRLAAAVVLMLAIVGLCNLLNMFRITQIPLQTSLILSGCIIGGKAPPGTSL